MSTKCLSIRYLTKNKVMKEALLDKIEAYLKGTMSAEEEAQFDKAVEQDPELAQAVDNFGIANDALEVLIEDNLRKELEILKSEETGTTNVISIHKKKPVARMRSLRTYLAAAASVALLLGFFGIQRIGGTYSNEAIYTEMTSDFSMPGTRTSNGTIHPFAEGFTAYQEGNYAQATQFFRNVVLDDPRYPAAQYYLGQSLKTMKNYAEAAEAFENVLSSDDIRFIEQAEWNNVLMKLADKQPESTYRPLLDKIADDENHTFHRRAVRLQSKLDSFWRNLTF